MTPQAGLYSAALTAFVIDSKQNLQVKPQDQMVYYLQQHSTILSQISLQLSSIAPQIPIPSTPPPPFPKFNTLVSDIRVNAFWFMALVFSLFAALLAILVQQWVRNYMHVFQRYRDPLKSARLRQYLHEGSEEWNMPRVAEAVPGLLHISLFLFFAGLGDTLLNINTTIGVTTVIPIGFGGLLYICTILAPIIYPQSPYQSSFSSVIWYLFQKLRWRKYRHRGPDGALKHVNVDMAQVQLQLAMKETEERKGRDEEAIRWLIDNLTGDAEMERFMMAIPGSFSTNWGVEVWRNIGCTAGGEGEDGGQKVPVATAPATEATPPVVQPPSSGSILTPIIHLVKKLAPSHRPFNVTAPQLVPHSSNINSHSTALDEEEDLVHELSTRVARSLDDCKNGGLFAKDEWRRRTRACIETTASLVFCANAKFAWFGDIEKLLGDIGNSEKPRELSLAGTDQFFVMHWTCLSLVAIRQFLSENRDVRYFIDIAAASFAGDDDTGDDQALKGAQKIDEALRDARECLYNLYKALPKTECLTEEGKQVIRNHMSEISTLETIKINTELEADYLENVDHWISATQSSIAPEITFQIPGVRDRRDDPDPPPVDIGHIIELSRDPRNIRFIRPGKALKSIFSLVPTLHAILQEGGLGNGNGDDSDSNHVDDTYKKMRKSLGEFHFTMNRWQENEIERQLWRLQDLRHACGFGYTVELFFLALSQLLVSTSGSSSSSSKKDSDSHSALYTGAFRDITSDWKNHKNTRGTQRLLLDIALSRGIDFQDEYPDYIVEAFLLLLCNIFEGQRDNIYEAIQRVRSLPDSFPKSFQARLLDVLHTAQAGGTKSS